MGFGLLNSVLATYSVEPPLLSSQVDFGLVHFSRSYLAEKTTAKRG
jgi:hypothetical protein